MLYKYPNDYVKRVTVRSLEDCLRRGSTSAEKLDYIQIYGKEVIFVPLERSYGGMTWEQAKSGLTACLDVIRRLPKAWAYDVFVSEHITSVHIIDDTLRSDKLLAWVQKHGYGYIDDVDAPHKTTNLQHHRVTVKGFPVEVSFHYYR